MSTGGIQCTTSVSTINTINWRNSSLNGFTIENGVTFALKLRRNGHTIDGKLKRERYSHCWCNVPAWNWNVNEKEDDHEQLWLGRLG
jgi:hypothetical protein